MPNIEKPEGPCRLESELCYSRHTISASYKLIDLEHSLQQSICNLNRHTHSFGAWELPLSLSCAQACEVHESQSSAHVGHIVQDINNVQVSGPLLGRLSFSALYKVPGDLPNPPPHSACLTP